MLGARKVAHRSSRAVVARVAAPLPRVVRSIRGNSRARQKTPHRLSVRCGVCAGLARLKSRALVGYFSGRIFGTDARIVLTSASFISPFLKAKLALTFPSV